MFKNLAVWLVIGLVLMTVFNQFNTRQPLQPFKPQQPLDIGLFETRLPESPHIIVPDE